MHFQQEVQAPFLPVSNLDSRKKKKKNLPLFQILSFHFFPSNSALKVISMKIMSFYSLPSQALLLFLPPPKLFLSWRGKSCGQQAVLCLGPSSHSLTLSSPVSRFKVMTQFAVHWRQRNDACRVKKKNQPNRIKQYVQKHCITVFSLNKNL